jgi:hypothetical protein
MRSAPFSRSRIPFAQVSRFTASCDSLHTHFFAVAGTLRVALLQPQKRHIPPERYAKYRLKF